MGFAVFQMRGGGGQVMFDADLIIGLQEDNTHDTTGQARIYVQGVQQPIALKDTAAVVYQRIVDARAAQPGTIVGLGL